MIFGETPQQRHERQQRARRQYPEVASSDVGTVIGVDALRRSEGRPLTSFGQALDEMAPSDPLPDGPLNGPLGPMGPQDVSRETSFLTRPGERGYVPLPSEVPGALDGTSALDGALGGLADYGRDVGRGVSAYGRTFGLGPPNPISVALAATSPQGRSDLGSIYNATTRSVYEGDNILLEELTRPINYVPLANVARGMSFAPKAPGLVRAGVNVISATAGRKAGRAAAEQVPEDAPSWVRPAVETGVGLAAGLGTGIAAGRIATRAARGVKSPIGLSVDDVSGQADDAAKTARAPEPAAILRDVLVPGENPGLGVLRRYEGAVNTQGLAIRRDMDAGNRALAALKIGRPTGQSRIVSVDDEMVQLYTALHGEGAPPPRLQGVFAALKQQVDTETAATVGFDPKFMAHPDYFPRGWKTIEVAPANASRAQSMGGAVGATPGFAKPRSEATFTEILGKTYTRPDGSIYRLEPQSWNPFEQMALRRVAGTEFREQSTMIDRLKQSGTAVVADGPLPEGYRVPRVGPAFEGKPKIAPGIEGNPPSFYGYTDRYAVPDKIADVLENAYGRRVSFGKGPEAILSAMQTAKRAKLLGSLFQQVDFSTRTGFASFGGALDDLISGHPIQAAAKVAKLPVEVGRIVAANLSPTRRAAIRDEILSGKAIFPDRPGITLKGVAEGGWNQADISIVRRDIRQAFTDSTAGESLTGSARRNLARLEAANQRGLFDGVYPQAQMSALKNWVLPRLMRQHPDWTDRQIMGQAADEINKAFSTLGDYQTIFKNPYVQHLTHNLIFSTNEPEALIRGAGSVFIGHNKRMWAEFYIGGAVFLAATANLIHMATTTLRGEPETLPVTRYNPLKLDERAPTGVGYNTRFLTPDTPIPGSGGRRTVVDLVGQMDTALRLIDPLGFLTARMNVGPRAIANQIAGKDYFGNRIDTVGPKGIISRAAALASDLYEPIVVQQLRSQVIAPGGAREPVGRVGGAVQAVGVNLRGETNAEAVGRGGYESLSGEDQFKAIPAQSWRLLRERAPAQFKAATEEYQTFGDWYRALIDEYEVKARERFPDEAEAQFQAEQAAERHPLYKAYLKAKDFYETEWYKANPGLGQQRFEEEMAKPSYERRNLPTKPQRAVIGAAP